MTRSALIDGKIPNLDLAWRRDRMAELLDGVLLSSATPHDSARDVEIERVDYSVGKTCVVRCSFKSAARPASPPRLAVVTLASTKRLAKLTGAASFAETNGTVLVKPLGCLVEIFPTDSALPTLPSFIEPELMAASLSASCDGDTQWAKPAVLNYRPHRRCVLRAGSGGWRPGRSPDVIVKVYPPGPAATAAFSQMATLRAGGRKTGLDVPQPLHSSERSGALIMECAPGESMRDVVVASAAEKKVCGVLELASRALVALHAIPLRSDAAPRTLGTQAARLRRRTARLSNVAPDLASEVDDLCSVLEDRVGRLEPEVVDVCHGDFSLNQLLTDGAAVSMVDLDRAGPGDPAVDVGNVMAKLRVDDAAARDSHLGAADEAFLLAYMGRADQGGAFVDRAHLMEVLALVRGAVRAFRHDPGSYIEDGAESAPFHILEMARRCLAEV